mgnify:CR=1 FL=1
MGETTLRPGAATTLNVELYTRGRAGAIEQRVPERLKERRQNLLAQLKDLNVESDSKRILAQPEVKQLPPVESLNRFHDLFGSFLSCLADEENPLAAKPE